MDKIYSLYKWIFGEKKDRGFRFLMNLAVILGLWKVIELRKQLTVFILRHLVKPWIRNGDWLY